jgi:hypothetical protein
MSRHQPHKAIRYRGRHRLPAAHRGRYLAAAGVVAAASIGILTDHSGGPAAEASLTHGGGAPVTADGGTPPAPEDTPRAQVEVVADVSASIPDLPTNLTENGVPAMALLAYQRAAAAITALDPGCHLPTALVAAIGKVESNHARGGQLDASGTAINPILGPTLNGGPFAAIADTDGGRLDGDSTWDRAVGPMQFIPSTWRSSGVDGNGDGRADPENIFDASLATGHYLCGGGRDLDIRSDVDAAIRRYNNSDAYLQLVLAWAARYSGAITAIPVIPTIPTSPASPGIQQEPVSSDRSGTVQVAAGGSNPAPGEPRPAAGTAAPGSTRAGSGSTSPSTQQVQPAQPAGVAAGLLGQVSRLVDIAAQPGQPAPACDPAAPPVQPPTGSSTSDPLLIQLCLGTTVVPLPTVLGLIGAHR